jgi:hypothetical protein
LADNDVKIPFFLDFRNIDEEKKKILEDVKDRLKEKSKILKQDRLVNLSFIFRDKFIQELGSEFE